MNDSTTALPHGVSEFDQAAIAREPSAQVRPPRIAEARLAFECRVVGEHRVGNGILVPGEVVHVAASRWILAEDGLPDPKLLAPLARLGRSEWGTLGDVIAIDRIRLTEWEAGKRTAADGSVTAQILHGAEADIRGPGSAEAVWRQCHLA
jgi:hypothetical protein